MNITFPTEHERHCQQKELFNGERTDASEIPNRIEVIKKQLVADYQNKVNVVLVSNSGDRWGVVSRIHAPEYLAFLQSRQCVIQPGSEQFWNDFWYGGGRRSKSENSLAGTYATDTYTAFTRNVWDVAMRSYNAVHTAGEMVLNGEGRAYALTRPPGHHAMRDAASGYCYLSNASIFANYLKERGVKVGILDIDFHHGNGAQGFFYDDPSVITASIHADPDRKFPYFSGYSDETGTGRWYGTNLNIPLEAGIDDKAYLRHLARACEFLRKNQVEFLIVCAGFDTYEKDPICDFKISIGGFAPIGRMIKELELPTLFVQEGWYNVQDLGKCVSSFFREIID